MPRLWRYVALRCVSFVPTLLLATVVVFAIIRLAPGDPATIVLGEAATPDSVAVLRRELGLDRPLWAQYGQWLGGAATGDLGRSLTLVRGYSVQDLIASRLPATLVLATYALALALATALLAGTLSALRHRRATDFAMTSAAVLGISMPDFWFAYVLVLLFSLGLGWFPSMGFVSPLEGPVDALIYGFLPACAIAAPMTAVFTRILRSSLLETSRQEYVLAGHALGFPPGHVFRHYVFRNALIPFVTVIGLQIRYLLGGVVVIEKVFAVPGLGSLLADAVFARDFVVVQGIAFAMVTIVLVVNLVVDLACAFLDPRVLEA